MSFSNARLSFLISPETNSFLRHHIPLTVASVALRQAFQEALRQWLLACNSVSHSLVEHQGAIAAYRPAEAWAKEDDGGVRR